MVPSMRSIDAMLASVRLEPEHVIGNRRCMSHAWSWVQRTPGEPCLTQVCLGCGATGSTFSIHINETPAGVEGTHETTLAK